MGEHIIKLPDVGEGVAEAELVEWNVAVGDVVREDAILASVAGLNCRLCACASRPVRPAVSLPMQAYAFALRRPCEAKEANQHAFASSLFLLSNHTHLHLYATVARGSTLTQPHTPAFIRDHRTRIYPDACSCSSE